MGINALRTITAKAAMTQEGKLGPAEALEVAEVGLTYRMSPTEGGTFELARADFSDVMGQLVANGIS